MLHLLSTLATSISDYDYYSGYDTTYTTAAPDASAFWMFFALMMIPALIVGVLSIVGLWKVYTKAHKPGWAAIVPIYNIIVLLEIVGRPTWWIFLLLLTFIPFVGWIVGLIIGIILANDLAKSFGKDVGYTLLLIFLPFVGYMMLGFGKDPYKGPAAASATPAAKA